jgi:hypothetical protein
MRCILLLLTRVRPWVASLIARQLLNQKVCRDIQKLAFYFLQRRGLYRCTLAVFDFLEIAENSLYGLSCIIYGYSINNGG